MTCPFCNLEESVIKNGLAYVRFDMYPVSNGHMLIVPFRHVSDFFDLSMDERNAIFLLVDEVKILLDEKHNPDGYNIGTNVGEFAGQTVWHAHLHVIPRYKGDMEDPRGGVRWIIPDKAKYWSK
ncbi:MAG: HIT family protein [Burkholderiaceae bacterium]|nr:MAG: HIT family protein [Burkholderiaceae bacterium]